MPLGLGFFAAAGAATSAAEDFELIQTTALSSAISSIEFASIPQTYKHLQIRCVVRTSSGTSSSSIFLRLNSVTSAVYANHNLTGNGTSVTSTAATAVANIHCGFTAGNAANASAFGPAVVDIIDYTSTTKRKTVRSLAGANVLDNAMQVDFRSGINAANDAISTITMFPPSGLTFSTGSRFSLYGLRG